MATRFVCFAFANLFLAALCVAASPDFVDRAVNSSVEGALAVSSGKLVRPAGDLVKSPGKPLDIAASPDGSLLFIKSARALDVIDASTFASRGKLTFQKEDKDSGSMHGLAVMRAGPDALCKLYFTCTTKELLEATINTDGSSTWSRKIQLTGNYNLGIALSTDKRLAYICMSANNTLGIVDLAVGKVIEEIPVGVAPYGIALSPDGKTAFVTNYGGHRPAAGTPSEKSYGTSVSVDKRSIPNSGTVSRIDLETDTVVSEVAVGLHPTQIVRDAQGSRYYIANANSDSVSVLDAGQNRVGETILVRPDGELPFGSIPDALTLSSDGLTLFVANAGNDAVAVISPARSTEVKSKIFGFIPTGWFPGAVLCSAGKLYIANTKSGTVQNLPVPDENQLKKLTAQVIADERIPQTLHEMERRQSDVAPVPVPAQLGDPSVFRHVVYILKENKTYDQVLGDIGKGNSDPRLCTYGQTVTPNHHSLANQFVLLDNYYCNGVNSSDGHQWATQGITGEYFEKGSRTYDFGTDALCYTGSDFIWDSCLSHGISIRNYGEFDFPSSTPESLTWFDVYKHWDQSGQTMFKQSIELQTLKQYTCKQYPGWNLAFPDVCRARVFLSELAGFEKSGEMPNFLLVYLPQDHTSGAGQDVPTPRAMVADNDLATGQVVEALSKSQFWKDTVIFVNEDDPQSGYDHVDGHRSLCLVASPYTKRNTIVSHFYNQTSVLHTMSRILGFPPPNQSVAMSPTMEDCFTATPDFHPYSLIPNIIPLDERNKPRQAMSDTERKLADAVGNMDFSRPDQVDDDKLNRLLWLSSGRTDAYPSFFAGPHGRGLAALHLKLDQSAEHDADDDDRDQHQ